MQQLKSASPRSEALKPWVWVVATGLGSSGLSAYSQTLVPWVTIAISIVGLINLGVAYWYLLLKHPDRLQSEDYLKHRLGDSLQGQIPNSSPATAANTSATQVST